MFQGTVAGKVSMWWMAADGTGVAERLLTSANPQMATSISPDGSHLIFHEATPASSRQALGDAARVGDSKSAEIWFSSCKKTAREAAST